MSWFVRKPPQSHAVPSRRPLRSRRTPLTLTLIGLVGAVTTTRATGCWRNTTRRPKTLRPGFRRSTRSA